MDETSLTTVPQTKMDVPRLGNSLFSPDLAPHYMQLANKLASSSLVPKAFQGKWQDLYICWSMGYQLGISPEQSMQCIAVINGRPCMWGDELLALCMAHPDFEDIIEEPLYGKDSQVIGYSCTIKRRKRTPVVSIFTLEMAKKAGLLAKGGVWNLYPERMLKLRARGYSLRDCFPDALKGIRSREEVEDYIVADYKSVDEKKSRTEQLKAEITQEPAQDTAPAVAVEAIVKEHVSTDYATPQQCKQILELIKEKDFPDSRLEKALKYYEADSIGQLHAKAADNFIEQLIKY